MHLALEFFLTLKFLVESPEQKSTKKEVIIIDYQI